MSRIALIRTLIVVAALAFGAVTAMAQGVLIAPNVVVVDARTRSTAITLVNNGAEPVEASLSTQFGVPATDSTGSMFLRTFDTIPDTMPSAAEWVHAYPERLILAAGERRAVRVLITPPANLAPGEYWSRLIVTTKSAAKRVSAEGAGVQIGLNLEVRSLLPLFYRVGPMTTGVTVGEASAALTSDSITVRVPLHREGNAAFVGSIHATIRDAHGTTVARDSLPLGVYYDLSPRMMLKRPALAPGRYTVAIDAIASRPDVNASLLVPGRAARGSAELIVPSGK